MGVIDEHVRDDMQPGDSGIAADARAVAKKANALGDLVTTGRLSEPELSASFVQFRNFDGSAVAAGSVVVITLTEDGTDIHDITVEEA